MTALIERFIDIRFIRYFLASGAALAVDMGVFFGLLAAGTLPAMAGATGYLAGLVAHWLMSSRAVFIGALAPPGRSRSRQKALFVGSAFAGLALTTCIVWAGTAAGFHPAAVKIVAIMVNFPCVWLMRSRIVFRD